MESINKFNGCRTVATSWSIDTSIKSNVKNALGNASDANEFIWVYALTPPNQDQEKLQDVDK